MATKLVLCESKQVCAQSQHNTVLVSGEPELKKVAHDETTKRVTAKFLNRCQNLVYKLKCARVFWGQMLENATHDSASKAMTHKHMPKALQFIHNKACTGDWHDL